LQGPLADLPAFRFTKLIVPACHDTASAIAGIPAQGDDWGFISSGTWSLVGCVLDSPCVLADARNANFSNEGGVGNRIYFLKNVNGMWLLRQCIEHWTSLGDSRTVEELIAECAGLKAPNFLLDVDRPDLLLPGDMPSRINAQLKNVGRTPIPDGHEMAPAMANLIFHSLADRYAAVLRDAKKITGKPLKRLYIVGGGSKNTLLNHLTAKATGLEVLPGSIESTTVGNFAVQLTALDGDYTDATGVSAGAVARWASSLATQPILAQNIRARKVDGTQPGIGEALA
jgi:rhamnulokinase